MPPNRDEQKGYLEGKDKDDCDRYVREVVQNYLENRTFDQRDEQMIKDAVGESIELRLSNHTAQCAQTRKSGGYNVWIIAVAIMSMLISLGMFLIMLLKFVPMLKDIPTP